LARQLALANERLYRANERAHESIEYARDADERGKEILGKYWEIQAENTLLLNELDELKHQLSLSADEPDETPHKKTA